VPATEGDVANLRAAYDALRGGDVAPLGQLMTEDIRWIGDSSLGDPPPQCNGRHEAMALIKRAATRIPFRDLESIDISGDRVFAVARWQEGQGPEGRERVFSLLTMRDGRIVRMQDFFDRRAAEQAFRTPG
jgi:ketosteroid isomerase-like protein